MRTRVRSLTRGPSGAWRLESPELGAVDVDRVVLTTGHAFPELDGEHARLAAPAVRRPPSGCPLRAWGLRGGHGSERPVGGSVVGVLGLGLSFYDVMAALTIGRGERFEAAGDGLQYEPSGREPLVVAGSRSGVPVPARGCNQKPPDYVYVPLLFHPVPDAPGAEAEHGGGGTGQGGDVFGAEQVGSEDDDERSDDRRHGAAEGRPGDLRRNRAGGDFPGERRG